MDEWDWHRTIDVNLSGVFFTTQQVSRVMRKQGVGIMINIAGWYGDGPLLKRNHAAFLSSQLGLAGLTLSAAEEFAMDHIRVNQVCLGLTDLLANRVEPALQAELQRTDLTRKDRLIRIVYYLCNPFAAGPTGQVVNLERSSEV
jgi:NAD(P)-dependent dehydrogenase (short-subunit alcohol dehydrogenase family)